MRVAAIDCGTNSIRLLIADIDGNNFREIVRDMEIVRLGQGVDQTGQFHPDAIARTLAAVDKFAAEIAKRGVEKIRFCATSATRDATNRDLFIEGVFERLGIRPEVISGEEEARLSFMGATKDLPAADGPFLVVDIGGGSTEFVFGTETVESAKSVNIGCVRMSERHFTGDLPDPGQVVAATEDIDEAIAFGIHQPPAVSNLLGIKEFRCLDLVRWVSAVRVQLLGIGKRFKTLCMLECSCFKGPPCFIVRLVLHIDLQRYGGKAHRYSAYQEKQRPSISSVHHHA